jgi:outer membrane protein assembly factor BamA
MRFRTFLPVLFLLSTAPLIHAQCGDKPTELYVAKVVFERQSQLTPEQKASIRARLMGRCFDESNLSELGKLAWEEYQNLGYFRARVQDPIVRVIGEENHSRAARLVLDVEEGPRYIIEQVIWSGINSFQADDIEETNPVRPGEVYDRSKVYEAIKGVKRFYVASGFPNVIIVPQVETVGNRLRVTFHVTEGQRIPPN